MTRGTIPMVKLSGTPGERGFQHGQALAEAIERFYHRWIAENAAATPPVHERDVLAYAMSHLPESRAYAPDLVEEVDGIAAGAKLPFEKVWLLNCFDEADGYALYRRVNAGRLCTTFVATGLSTKDGTTYMGQTWDAREWYEPVMLQIEPGHGEIGVLMFTHPGVVAGTGINAAGLAIVWNTLRCLDARNGVPCTFLIRKALQQTKLSDAMFATVSGVRAAGFNFIIGADFGAVNVEATATKERVRYVGRHLGHANHYEEPELLQFEGHPAADPPGTTRIRAGRMNQLLDQAAGQIDLERCKQILSDHANYPASICRHKDLPKCDFFSRAVILYALGQGLMLVTAGPACENPWMEYRMPRSAGVQPPR